MSMLEIDYKWTSSGAAGGLTPVYLAFGAQKSVLTITCSTLASTQSISFQTSGESTGPWVIEATATLSTDASTAAAIRVEGPYTWMRPFIHSVSTGSYILRLVGTS